MRKDLRSLLGTGAAAGALAFGTLPARSDYIFSVESSDSDNVFFPGQVVEWRIRFDSTQHPQTGIQGASYLFDLKNQGITPTSAYVPTGDIFEGYPMLVDDVSTSGTERAVDMGLATSLPQNVFGDISALRTVVGSKSGDYVFNFADVDFRDQEGRRLEVAIRPQPYTIAIPEAPTLALASIGVLPLASRRRRSYTPSHN